MSNSKTKQAKTKMFNGVTKTWNLVVSCTHLCINCWCRKLAETKLRHLPYYRDFTKPKLITKRLNETFKPGEFIFTVDMGDLFCEAIPSEWITKVINHVERFPKTTFLFLTKNPARYLEFIHEFPENCILGTTIETNRDDYSWLSKAPKFSERFDAMMKVKEARPELRRFISIEPILDFDPEILVDWIIKIEPCMVYVGYDNYNYRLPEPSLEKT